MQTVVNQQSSIICPNQFNFRIIRNEKKSSETSVSSEPIFIDRDPVYFPHVLKYLREGKVKLTLSTVDIERIREDAEVPKEEYFVTSIFDTEVTCSVLWSRIAGGAHESRRIASRSLLRW